jgi:hypothetical protein
MRQQLVAAHRQAQDLLRRIRQAVAQLHRRRLLHGATHLLICSICSLAAMHLLLYCIDT